MTRFAVAGSDNGNVFKFITWLYGDDLNSVTNRAEDLYDAYEYIDVYQDDERPAQSSNMCEARYLGVE